MYVISLFQYIFFSLNFSLKLLRSFDEFLLEFKLEVIFWLLSNLKSAINFRNSIRFLFSELNSLILKIAYHCFSIQLFRVQLSFCLHSRINIAINNESLSSHSNVPFGNYLKFKKNYIDDFTILLKSIVKSIFKFVNRYFFIKIVYVNSIIGSYLPRFVVYRVDGINLPC